MEAARAMPAPIRADPGPTANGGLALATPAVPVEREPDADRLELPPPDRLSGAALATLAAVAGMAAIALGLFAFAKSVSDDGGTEILRPPISEAAQAISLLSKPTTVRLPLAGADGKAVLAVAANGRGMLVLDGFGIAPVGRTYQAWVISQRPRSTPLTGALFTGVETVVPLTARVEPGAVVGITIERASGAAAPSETLTLMTQRPAAAG
jgi:Anti-sigma-K factor rskA